MEKTTILEKSLLSDLQRQKKYIQRKQQKSTQFSVALIVTELKCSHNNIAYFRAPPKINS